MTFDADTDNRPADLVARAAYESRYWRQLAAHPHPGDPDHPGPMYSEVEDE